MKNKGVHGGNIYEASKIYGIKQEDILDYSANINPLGVPLSIRNNIISNIDNLINYPDPECTTLRTQISRYLNISFDKIIVGNGASEVIFLLFDVLRLKRLLIPAPTFSEYASGAERLGVKVNYFQLREEDNFRLDVHSLKAQITDVIDAVILCNPNNPTSTLINRNEMQELVEFACDRGVFIIVDEAFIELTIGGNSNSIVDFLDKYTNVFIIRAFTKLFAVPGLRLGYGLGSSEIIRNMWDKKLPWSVNTFAENAGDALQETEYLEKTALWLSNELEWFYNELRSISGLRVFCPNTNFVLIKILLEGLNAPMLKDMMVANGILIRDASNFVFLNDKFFRVAVKDRESNVRLIKTLKEVLGA